MLPPWLTKPEVIFSTVLTVLFFIGSLYAGEIRRSFHWPRKAMIKSLLKFSETELKWIELLHENAYYLLLWLARSVFDMFNLLFWIMASALVVNVIGYLVLKHFLWTSWVTVVFGPMMGAVIGRARRDYGIIKSLYNYDKTVATLKNNIEVCKAELGLPK